MKVCAVQVCLVLTINSAQCDSDLCTDNLICIFFSVTLSADGVPAPGGYVVPEGGNITFTCNNSVIGGVFWEINLQDTMGTVRSFASSGLDGFRQLSSPDETESANPAIITISNIMSENNRSFVECYREGSGMSNATIIVEGEDYTMHINYSVYIDNYKFN